MGAGVLQMRFRLYAANISMLTGLGADNAQHISEK
jgi:hypothetical protein